MQTFLIAAGCAIAAVLVVLGFGVIARHGGAAADDPRGE